MTQVCIYVCSESLRTLAFFSVASGRWTSSGKQCNIQTKSSFYIHILRNLRLRRRVPYMTLTCTRCSAEKQQMTLHLLLCSVCRRRTVSKGTLHGDVYLYCVNYCLLLAILYRAVRATYTAET